MHEHVLDVGHAEQDVLHFLGKDLLAADVDELGLPAEHAHVVTPHLDRVAGIHPSLGIER